MLFDWLVSLVQLSAVLSLSLSAVLLGTLAFYWFKVKRYVTRHKQPIDRHNKRPIRIAFFHPFCNGGGGGERVLWQAIRAIQIQYPRVLCAVYTCDEVSVSKLLDNISRTFYIDLLPNLELICLDGVSYIQPESYPRFTILLQSIGSLFLAHEALHKHLPDIFCDTIGFAFTLSYFKHFGRCLTCCYVHYPTVSSDMLHKVKSQTDSFNNSSSISSSSILTNGKMLYYRLYGYLYAMAGSTCDVTLVNSTWTKGHIDTIWGQRANAHILYPPCDTNAFAGLELTRQRAATHFLVCSLGQFRPEKNHVCQLRAFKHLLESVTDVSAATCELHMIGSCRDDGDLCRVQQLRRLAEVLEIDKQVKFHIKIPFHELLQLLGACDVGMHTMENEHFGISLVEMMAAGCVLLGHNSGGPRCDIIREFGGEKTGYLAADELDFGEKLREIYSLSEEERTRIRTNARNYVLDKFSIDTFEREFLLRTETLFDRLLTS